MKISVIIPAYNVEAELINRCVDRLLNQKFNDYEIIVINDGSDKEHEDVLINLQSKSTKIKVLNQENRGVSSARNRGTELAAGEYICYVDADDMVSDNYLEEAYNIAVEKQADIVIGGNGYTNKQYKMQDDAAIVDTYNGDEINALRKYMVGNRLMKLGEEVVLGQGPWNRLVKADIAKKTVFDTSLKIGEDIVWNYQLLDRAKRVCVAHKLWYWYYINPVSASENFDRMQSANRAEAWTKLKNV